MSKAMSVKALHDYARDEDTIFFGLSSAENKSDFELGLCSGNSQKLARPLSHSMVTTHPVFFKWWAEG